MWLMSCHWCQSGYYDWLTRRPSRRARANDRLLARFWRVHATHRGHRGAAKTWRVLNHQGGACGKHRVARLRQRNGIVAKRRKRFNVTTHSRNSQCAA
ncbi:MAG: hypothetical protein E2O35_07885 [Proteobacteria bacterium]|nr:MAG: hypothetical protein E2O35_07885 [Pseudomonadota bacterium]